MKQMAEDALRVIGLAYRDYPAGSTIPPSKKLKKD